MSRRHNAKVSKLNMNFNQRKALLRSQMNALITVGKIETTQARAKLVKILFDKLASKAQDKTLSSRRQTAGKLASPKGANRLVESILPVMGDRRGGFTRMTKLFRRRGDGATLVRLELTNQPAVVLPAAKKPKVKPVTKTKKETKK